MQLSLGYKDRLDMLAEGTDFILPKGDLRFIAGAGVSFGGVMVRMSQPTAAEFLFCL